jgi:capsular polysaccharide biosynthesis protein
VAESDLTFDPVALAVAADNERSIGQVFLNWPDAGELEMIAQAAIVVLQTRNQEYFPQLGDQPARVTLLDEVRIVPAPPPLANRFAPLIRIGVALLAGIGLAFLAEYFDSTLRSREEVEQLGLPVIATIPRDRR